MLHSWLLTSFLSVVLALESPDPSNLVSCALGCSLELQENADCNPECDNEACNYDNGHCQEIYCSDFCYYEQLGDGTCDRYCDNESCEFDKGDCSSFQSPLYRIISIAGFCLIAAVFLCLCVMLFLYIRRHRFRIEVVEDNLFPQSEESARPVTRERIEAAFPVCPYSKDMLQYEDPICVICLEEFVERVLVRRMPCGHLHHADCLEDWLLTRPQCPQCKQNPFFDCERHAMLPSAVSQ